MIYLHHISKEFYRKTYSHNTIVVDGKDQNLKCESSIKLHNDNIFDVNIKDIYIGLVLLEKLNFHQI